MLGERRPRRRHRRPSRSRRRGSAPDIEGPGIEAYLDETKRFARELGIRSHLPS